MLAQYTQLLFWSIPTFRLAVGIAILLSIVIGFYSRPASLRNFDVYLGALLLGIIGARAFHVVLNWDYFTDSRAEITIISAGGLDWHGALIGGLLGIALVLKAQRLIARHPRQSFNGVLLSLTPVLPLIGLGGWVGCLAAGCGYGKEVDSLANYPRWMTSELVDVFGIVAPRYNTPYFGIVLCGLGLLFVFIWAFASRKLPDTSRTARRFWLLLTFLSAGMFIIGFYRADHSYLIDGLRADQILDVMMGLWSLVLAFRVRSSPRSEST